MTTCGRDIRIDYPDAPEVGCGEFAADRTEDGSLRIVRADPRILISMVMLGFIESRYFSTPEITLTRARENEIIGSILRIDADQTVIYRIAAPSSNGFAYIAEWPD